MLPIVIVTAARIANPGAQTPRLSAKPTKQQQQAGEARRLGRDAQERGDRHRRPLVCIRRPEMERHGTTLKAKPTTISRMLAVTSGSSVAPPALRDRRQVRRAGHPVDHAHAEEHHRAGEHPDEEELQRPLLRARPPCGSRRSRSRGRRRLRGRRTARACRGSWASPSMPRTRTAAGSRTPLASCARSRSRTCSTAARSHADGEEQELEQHGVVVDDEHPREGLAAVADQRHERNARRR